MELHLSFEYTTPTLEEAKDVEVLHQKARDLMTYLRISYFLYGEAVISDEISLDEFLAEYSYLLSPKETKEICKLLEMF